MNRAQTITALLEAFLGHGPIPRDTEYFSPRKSEHSYDHTAVINGVTYEFSVTINDGAMSLYWDRGGSTNRIRGYTGTQEEAMKAMSIITRMARHALNKHRNEIEVISFSGDIGDPKKHRLYTLIGKKLARDIGGRFTADPPYYEIELPRRGR